MLAGILWALIVFLVAIWLVGFVLVHAAGPMIHILLLVALVLLVWNLLSASRTSV